MICENHILHNMVTGRTMHYYDMNALKRALKRFAKKGYHPYVVGYSNGYYMSIRQVPNFRSMTPGYQGIEQYSDGTKVLQYARFIIKME